MKASGKIWQPIDFTVYFSFTKWTVVLLLVLEIVFRLWASRLMTGPIYNNLEIIAWIIRIIFFAFLGWRVVKNFGFSTAIAAIAGGIAGFINGIIIALFRFGSGMALWKFFNLITETILATVVASLVVVLITFIFSFKSNN